MDKVTEERPVTPPLPSGAAHDRALALELIGLVGWMRGNDERPHHETDDEPERVVQALTPYLDRAEAILAAGWVGSDGTVYRP